MEDFKLPVSEKGTPAAVQHDKQRNLLRRLQPEDFERHLVAERPKSDCWYMSDSEDVFNLHLRAMFIVLLTFAVITVSMTEVYFQQAFPSHGYGLYFRQTIKGVIVLLVAKLAVVLTVGVIMKKTETETSSRPTRKEEENRKISVVQQV